MKDNRFILDEIMRKYYTPYYSRAFTGDDRPYYWNNKWWIPKDSCKAPLEMLMAEIEETMNEQNKMIELFRVV